MVLLLAIVTAGLVEASETRVELIGDSASDTNPDVKCGGDVEHGKTSCERTGFSRHTVETAVIEYCAAGDCDNDGDDDVTTGRVTLQAWDSDCTCGDSDIWFEQTFQNGNDLDATDEVNDGDCGFWQEEDNSVEGLTGKIDKGEGTCEQVDKIGWWKVGLDWESE